REVAQRDPDTAAVYDIAAPGLQAAANMASANRIADTLSYTYLGLLVGTIGLRAWRGWHVRRFRAIRITYPAARVVTVPLGFSLLEASRWAGIPHASVCGGRARCSTCRVRIIQGAEHLAPPSPAE